MIKLKTQPVNVRNVYTLFFLVLVLLHTSCGERPEQDAGENAQNELRKQFQNDNPQIQFEKALKAISDNSKDDENQRAGHTKVALEIIDKHLNALDTDPKSLNNPLNLVLEAMKEVSSGFDVLKVSKHTRIEKYIQLFNKLHEKGVRLDDTILNPLTDIATKAEKEMEILYYPLVVLGTLKADHASISTKGVTFKQNNIVEKNVPILWWTLRKADLNKELKKKMVEILVKPKEAAPTVNKIFTIPDKYSKVNDQKLTPAMYVAYKDHKTVSKQDSNDIAEMFEYFLHNPGIKLFKEQKDQNKEQSFADAADKELTNQPLLSFIVFNAIRNTVSFRDRWLAVLDKALQSESGLKALDQEKTKQFIRNYVRDYIDTTISQEGSGFDLSEAYDQFKVKEVRARLADYIKETIPQAKAHNSNGNDKEEHNNKKQEKKKKKGKKGSNEAPGH
jgi:hypothetical protein